MVERQRVLEFMKEKAYSPLPLEELARALEVPRGERDAFAALLDEMEASGAVVKTRAHRYGVPERMSLVVGRLSGHPRGYGFVVPDRPGLPDVYVGPEALGGAMHGDRVVARLHGRRGRNGRGPEGEVIRVLSRANRHVVGRFERTRRVGFVRPDDRRVFWDVLVTEEDRGGALDGDKVVVEVTRWPSRGRNPEGRVVERLGRAGEPGVDVLSVMRKHGLSEGYPPEVEEEVARVIDRVAEADLRGREDLRGLTVVTIDGEDARDLDDAVSVETGRGKARWRLGVHIADVSHYVREGTAVDREARRRATSVYLVDRAIHMLPPRLSAGICSLSPRVDRLALTVFIDFDHEGRRLSSRIGPSVIRSAERMTYGAVAGILEEGDRSLAERYAPLVPAFREMEALAAALRRRREERGAVDFDMPEVKVSLDELGRPVSVARARRTVADRIIEEFMLAANEAVAERLAWLKAPFLYRVHEDPDGDKMEAFAQFALNLGYRLKGTRSVHPGALQRLLARARGRREEYLLTTVLLRSMKRARYSHEPLGHFGLAARHYTHFTSPIRRYPDLAVHRIIKRALEGDLTSHEAERLEADLPGLAAHCSEMELRAEEAERETVDLKKAEFMEGRLGEVFDGVISGVAPYGLYVALENTVEGLVHVSTMTDDYYVYREEAHSLVGERTRKTYRIGDPVRVQVWRVSVEDRSIDFGLVS